FDDDLKELKAFRDKPSSYTASELISRGLDYTLNVDNKVYLNYIATRDGAVVEPTTKHGLFDLEGTADLKSFKEIVNNYSGRVYKMIISLPYNSDFREKEKWEMLIRSSHPKIAKVFNRNVSDIAWVGAVHEASNPHVHLMIWSKTERELNLNKTEFKKAMEYLKVTFAQKIYKNEFRELNLLRQETMQGLRSELMKHLKLYNQGIFHNGLDVNTFHLMQEYAQDIPDVKYGYQSPENKAKINQILVSLIEHHPDLYKMLEVLIENQSKRIDYYNISKDVDKKDHVEQFIQKLFYPSKNDKPILQNILIAELQS
ncbi:relaxase MobL, partial [Erysipelothrix rhusiopathiae]|uniref:relaxase MobL n=1 Tax=Erysipelothrix rhusiopathiae TaxID=1648 RepID=UPI003F47442F